MARSYGQLLSPGRIGSLRLRNRILMTPMGSNLGEGDGLVGERARAYYGERARGGAALMVMGSVAVAWPISGVILRQAAISEERHIPGIKAVAEEVHRHGGKLALQLHFGGLMSTLDTAAGRPLWTPSLPQPKAAGDMMDGILEEEFAGLSAPLGTAAPKFKVLTAEDIAQLVGYFAAAAERARRAGADGVEIHAGHGYIISAFLSPNTNHRTDAYGGSVENRSRVLTEVIAGIRATVGPRYPLWCRLDSQEFLQPNGISLEDAKSTARLAQSAGADAIHVSAYADAGMGIAHSSAHTPQQAELLVANAVAIKAAVTVPVIAVGRIDPDAAERHIGAGRFDFVAMGRKLLADPYLPRKLADGMAATVRPCVYSYHCNSQIYVGGSVKCAVNADTGFERELALLPAARKKHVVVAGGGPAGMEAARRLALKGHRVTLFEASDRLGGHLRAAAHCYDANEPLLRWLARSLAASSVRVKLNTEATREGILAAAPEEVVVATGCRYVDPAITGSDLPHVIAGAAVGELIAAEARAGALKSGSSRQAGGRSPRRRALGRTVVLIGDDLIALEAAEFLARSGRCVCVITAAAQVGKGVPLVRRWRLLANLRELGVTLLSGARDIAIRRAVVSYVNRQGQTRTLAADGVVIVEGAAADLALAEALRAEGLTVHTAGDCNGVGYLEGAMRAAAHLAVKI
jgi:2,4-dienoyl-CoA reductase-like NADH-dependent reductase (Old Yellow Enzyme family)